MTAQSDGGAVPAPRALGLALERVRVLLERHRARAAGATSADAVAALPPVAVPSLDRLAQLFRLTPFESDVVLLCGGVELDAAFAAVVASIAGAERLPTFSVAFASLPGAHWSAATPESALRRWRLLDADFSRGLTAAPLRLDERVLHYLVGVDAPDARLAGMVEPVAGGGLLAPSQRALAERIAAVWSAGPAERAPLIQLSGDVGAEKVTIAAATCAVLGARLSLMYADAIPADPHAMASLARLWEREARLSGCVLLVDLGELELADATRNATVLRFLELLHAPVILAGRERRRLPRRAVLSYEVERPSSAEQADAWRAALGSHAAPLNGTIDRLVAQFRLGEQAITASALEAVRCSPDPALLPEAVWSACRMQARPRLEDLAQRIAPHAGWDDLVLPEGQRAILRDITAQVRQRATVYECWGFGRPGSRGLGISALFAGASGTGKTTAAEVLATELQLDLYRIDLSAVVSKYIGETEKNLRRLFDAAEEGGAILLFDEADALFGKRSDVKDSHDRYANIEVSYLLQRMESYRGLAILTSNLKNALDSAFLRRIRFVVQFPFPDPAQRAEIWRRVFPRQTPILGLRPERLAQLDVTGGNIRNIALNAAFLAADDAAPVSMQYVLEAARGEYAKIEKPLTAAETTGWLDEVSCD